MFKLFSSKRLKKHLALPESSSNIELTLILADGKLLSGDLIDININEAVVSFSPENCSNFTLNEKVQLRLRANETQKTLFINAMVKDLRMDTDNGAKSFLFQFIGLDSLPQKLDDYFWMYFNCRHSYRVKINPTIIIKVLLERGNYFAYGRLLNISIGGICLQFDIMVAQRLDPLDELTLSFQLPECETMFKFAGSVCYCKLIKNIFRCGIKFDRSKTKDFLKQETIISNYVMRRQVEMARID